MVALRVLHQPCLLPALWFLALAADGCRRYEEQAYPRTSTVTVAYCCGERVLSPSMGMPAQFLVFLPLVTRDEKGEFEGRLARRWEHTPDYREWTYHLRTDVRWHDGVPVTAHDIKFSIELLIHPDVLYYPAGTMSITVLDDSTFTIRYAGSPGPHDWWTVYYPKHLLEELDPKEFSDWEFWTQPVGNGPYRYVRHVRETMMEFDANPEYYRGKPKIERVVLKFVGDAALTELLSGNVDAITDVDPAQIPRLAADPRFRVYHSIGYAAHAIYWQHDRPLFWDPRVRRALTLAINRRELLQVLNLPENIPVVDGPFTDRQLRRGQLPEPLPYDPARARALLEATGWRDRNGDGVREREGKEFRFTAIVPATGGWEQIAVFAQDQLRRVGVRMDVQSLEFGTVQGKLRSGEFDAAFTLSGYVPWWLQLDFGEDSPISYQNAEVVELIDRVQLTADPDARDRIYRELTEIFRADVPVTFLVPAVGNDVAHRRIRGLSSPYRPDPIWYMEDLWLEDED